MTARQTGETTRSVDLDTLYEHGRALLGVDRGENPVESNPEYTRAVVELIGDVDPNLTGFAEERLPVVADKLGLDPDRWR